MATPIPKISFDYTSKVVVVTGAAAGIGLAITEAFAEAGATIALVDRAADVAEVASHLGKHHQGWSADVSDPQAIEETAKSIAAKFDRVDVLVNNAGIGPLAPAEEYALADWERTMAVNLRAPFLLARALAPGMMARGHGRIINIASQASVIGIEGHVAYCASKAGIVGMTNCMALEWGPKGVTVNAISPTVVETELGLRFWTGEKGDKARAAIPTRRFAQPWEIAAAVLYLASDAAAMINGANWLVDGGYTII